MNYSDELDCVINNAMDDLIKKFLKKEFMFDEKRNYEYEKTYINLKSFEINSNF